MSDEAPETEDPTPMDEWDLVDPVERQVLSEWIDSLETQHVMRVTVPAQDNMEAIKSEYNVLKTVTPRPKRTADEVAKSNEITGGNLRPEDLSFGDPIVDYPSYGVSDYQGVPPGVPYFIDGLDPRTARIGNALFYIGGEPVKNLNYPRPKCRNCDEPLAPMVRWKLCPSCRLAYGKGAAIMFAIGVLFELVKLLWKHI